jgi:hypothetical protein
MKEVCPRELILFYVPVMQPGEEKLSPHSLSPKQIKTHYHPLSSDDAKFSVTNWITINN